MKFETFISKLLTNKYVLYIVSFLAIMNVIGYMISGKVQAVIVFILVGCIMTYFSKNMIIILLTPLIFTALLTSISKGKMEGFQIKSSGVSSSGGPVKLGKGHVAAYELANDITAGRSTPPTSTVPVQTASETSGPVESSEQAFAENSEGDSPVDTSPDNTSPDGDNAEANVEANDDTDLATDASPVDENFEVGMRKRQNRLDYGSTLEAAYEDLNNALGSDGIRRLTDDTQRLMKQQLELANAMKGMTPMLKQAQDMLKSLNITEIGDVTSLVKQLGATSILNR